MLYKKCAHFPKTNIQALNVPILLMCNLEQMWAWNDAKTVYEQSYKTQTSNFSYFSAQISSNFATFITANHTTYPLLWNVFKKVVQLNTTLYFVPKRKYCTTAEMAIKTQNLKGGQNCTDRKVSPSRILSSILSTESQV